MTKIYHFPAKKIREWKLIEKTMRIVLENSGVSTKTIETVIDRMKIVFEEFQFKYKFSLPESDNKEIVEFEKALHKYIAKLMFGRFLIEIKLAIAQGHV